MRNCNDSRRDGTLKVQKHGREQYIYTPHESVSPTMVMSFMGYIYV